MFTSTRKIIKSYFDLSMITSNELILTAKLQFKKTLPPKYSFILLERGMRDEEAIRMFFVFI